MKLFFSSLVLLFLIGCSTSQKPISQKHSSKNCLVVRAALDIGSGDTKMKVARVNTCSLKIDEILLETKRDVNYKGDLSRSNNKTFSKEILEKGRQALRELQAEALVYKPSEITSVATAAFREAKNAKSYIESLNHEFNLKIQIIPQSEEGVLGFYAALSKVPDMDPSSSLVWDIGGGSMQMIIQNQEKHIVYEGKMASIPFKNHITQKIQKRRGLTPNPIKHMEVQSALVFAKDFARRTVKKEIQAALNRGYTVYGIGGVHNYSILSKLEDQSSYSTRDLENLISQRLNKTDEELGNGEYVSTDTSNPILVKGFMELLGIQKVHVLKVNLADGLLVNDKYWMP